MHPLSIRHFIVFLFSFLILAGCNRMATPNNSDDYLLLVEDTTTHKEGYKNKEGKIIIPIGNYKKCYTDTFRQYAIVFYKDSNGWAGIDRNEKMLYNVFTFDNGPDYVSDNLFRITANNKIGYADVATGNVIIKPQFDGAFPFENGVAKVSMHCKTEMKGAHQIWTSDNWYYIDKKGNKTNTSTTEQQ